MTDRIERYRWWSCDQDFAPDPDGEWVQFRDIATLLEREKFHRWNIEEDGNALLICESNHEKTEQCEYTRYVPATELTNLLERCEKAEAEAERIKAINVKHCEAVNTLLVDGSRWQDRAELAERQRDEALKEVQRLRNELTDTIARTANANAKRLRAARNAMGEQKT